MKAIGKSALIGTFSYAMLGSWAAQAEQTADPAPLSETKATTVMEDTADNSLDIVVTAQKRSERLSEVPLSITAVSGATLETLGVDSASDLKLIVPGFTATATGYGAPVYTLRGMGTYDEAIAVAPTVSVYLDQVPYPFSRMSEGVAFDLERVEVLKGPQGTLFGQNSTGGAINFIAAKPTSIASAGLIGTFGRFGEADLEGFISGPITETLKARLALRSEIRGDWQKSQSSDRTLGQRNFQTGRFILDWEPSSDLIFELNANGWINRSDTQALQFQSYAPALPGGNPQGDHQALLAATPVPPRNARIADWDALDFYGDPNAFRHDDSLYQISLRGDLKVGDRITLTSITAYTDLKVNQKVDADATALLNLNTRTFGGAEVFSQELRVAGASGASDQFKWMLGASYQKAETTDTIAFDLNATNTENLITARDTINQDNTTKAVFGSVDFDVTDHITLYGSARYTKHVIDFNGCLGDLGDGFAASFLSGVSTALSGSPTTILPGQCGTLNSTTLKPYPGGYDATLSEDNVSWRAGISWKPRTTFMIYANVTRGYKAGSFSNISSLTEKQYKPNGQEAVLAYEAGLKTSFFDRKVDLSAAAFYYDYTDKQLLGTIDSGFPFFIVPSPVSIPKSEVAGGEIDISARPFRGLTLRQTANYTHTNVKSDFTTFNTAGGLISIKGSSFPTTPKWQLSTDAEYRFKFGESVEAYIGAHYLHTSSTLAQFADTRDFRLPEFGLLDVRAGFATEAGTSVQLWARNLTNKYYLLNIIRLQDTVTRTTGMPITFGITVGQKW